MQRENSTHYEAVAAQYKSALAADSADELLASDGRIHPHWHTFMQSLERLGLDEMGVRDREMKRLLRENGVTYILHGEQRGHRPWELDPIPLILSNTEWQRIAAGLDQRVTLLNLILADLYGERRLIKAGVIPPEVVYAHAGFLRACVGLVPAGSPFLLNYAADLARREDGALCVLADWTQAPSGAGYALENRTVLARALPTLFGEVGVHRLSAFFRTVQNSVVDLQRRLERTRRAVPHPMLSDPHIVLLTPGPLNETYFEHAYLANYLGYTLVQGDDLTVWDDRVWLKSIDGLRPVDIILRRVSDDFCDPLELRQESRLGVAGLLEVIRQGNVSVINPPGSGVLENRGLLPFLPDIAKYLMDAELRLPSVPTVWCGDPTQLAYVLERLDRFIVKPIHRHRGISSAIGPQLDATGRDALRDRLRAAPHLYVAQEYVNFSTTPALIAGKLEPRHATFRCFLFAEKERYAVMPGALTRCAAEKDSLTTAIQQGGVSKDTWILASEPEEPHISLWQQRTATDTAHIRLSDGLSSRAAENLFWVGRYAERAEGQARLLRIVLDRINMESLRLGQVAPGAGLTETLGEDELAYLRGMLRALIGLTASHADFTGDSEQSLGSEILSILLDTANNGSLVSTLQSLVSAAYAVRDRWSTDTWRVMNGIEHLCTTLETGFRERGERVDDFSLQEAEFASLDQLMMFLSALSGLTAESMTRTIGWMSLDMGRRIERALLLILLCRSSLVAVQDSSVEDLLLESVLASAESLITYRSRYRSAMHVPTVLDLLLLDANNPRSLLYQLKRLEEQISGLPRERRGYRLSEEAQLILEALTQLQLSDMADLSQRSEGTSRRGGLEKLLVRLSQLLIALSEVLTQTYFSHVQRTQQIGTPTGSTRLGV